MMVGRPVQLVVHKAVATPGDVALSVDDLHVIGHDGRTLVDHVNLAVHDRARSSASPACRATGRPNSSRP